MFEDFSKRNKAVHAAPGLPRKGWKNVTFTAIADRTGLSLMIFAATSSGGQTCSRPFRANRASAAKAEAARIAEQALATACST
jgi:hypothetical protein